jgi:prepilin-type N-terminal cleavage/methylation domain-containing protein
MICWRESNVDGHYAFDAFSTSHNPNDASANAVLMPIQGGRNMTTSRKGFTLIELLIVVAIIAILALIAVPNFLEAQMRSKVSRVYSDMRATCVAIEAYRLDNNDYPASLTPEPVTTPIPYMTTLPTDAFASDDTRQRTRRTFEYVKRDMSANFRTDNLVKDYYEFNWPYLDPFTWRAAGGTVPTYLGSPQAQWELKSWGPDRLATNCAANNGRGDDFSLAYDATNGTVSHGDLCRFGP